MKTKHFFSIDLGATSGRTVVAALGSGSIEIRELTRFPNPIIETNGHYYWDIYALYNEIIKALRIVAQQQIAIESIGIDTWGVDFAFVGKDGELLRQPYSYRDTHTIGAPEVFFRRVPRERVYELTGIQIMNFNSLYQLDTIRQARSSVYPLIDKVVFIPDLLAYMLTGNIVTEYTIASTSQLLNPATRQLEPELLEALGLTADQFGPLVYPGARIGTLNESVKRQTGLGDVPVVAVAGHDTASAVAAVPAENNRFAYLSSGTWSLMGVELQAPVINRESYSLNFTNEGGVDGTVRFLKNICGMWLLECCRREWGETSDGCSHPELIGAAMQEPAFASLINPDALCFANPSSMVGAIRQYCRSTGQVVPETRGQITRCIFESLALRYRQVFGYLQTLTPFPIEKLHVIGGGSQNDTLNAFTANALGIEVVAGPAEATAIGNVMLQAKAAGEVASLDAMRALIRSSVNLRVFRPSDREKWERGYAVYQRIYRENIE